MWKRMVTITMLVIVMAGCNTTNNTPTEPQNYEPTNFQMDRNNDMNEQPGMNQAPQMNRQDNMNRQNGIDERSNMNGTDNFNDDMNNNNLNREPLNEDGTMSR